MKKIVALLGLLVGFSYCLNANKIVGPVSYSNKTITTPVDVVGPFSGTKVNLQQLTVVGPVNLKDSKVAGEANIVGPLTVKETQFDREVKVTGSIEAKDSVFEDFVTVYGTDVSVDLDGTTLKDIIIKEIPGQVAQTTSTQMTITMTTKKSAFDVIGEWFGREVPAEKTTTVVEKKVEEKKIGRTVRLKNSTVTGSIIFKGLEGTVILDDTSSVGKVINGIKKGNGS